LGGRDRRTEIVGQPGKKLVRSTFHPKKSQVWLYKPLVQAMWEAEVGEPKSKAHPGGRSVRLYLKINKAKRTKAVAQVVEILPNKFQALSSKP
jgi:hypothetical protein